MAETISYRHNTMTIQSLDTFVNIKGGCYNGLRDVYFIRALGELPNMNAAVQKIDRKMDEAVENHRLLYRRVTELPKLQTRDESDYYSKAYDAWKTGRPIQIRISGNNELLKSTLSRATKETLSIYQKIKANCSDTMLKDFTVKLWFWSDSLLKDVFTNWTEKLSVKIIVNDITKIQEYLFLYMITLLGCDILILNNKADINAPNDILSLSYPLKIGPFGQTVISKYKAAEKNPPVSSQKMQQPSATTSQIQNNQRQSFAASSQRQTIQQQPKNNTASGRTTVPNANMASRTIVNSSSTQSTLTVNNTAATEGNKEKSFEELAQLASSIVMIAVLNNKGEPTATGSGIMVGKNGFILTNNHVVKEGRIFAVRIEDDENVYATDEIIKYNPDLDLAVIRIKKTLKPLRIYDGKQKLVRGQKVVAIGSPLGLFNSVSDGIISGFRNIKNVDMIQFTAPISHGSSGGAVLNMQGDVIGISTAGIDSGQNINLAVDYKTIKAFVSGIF